MSDANKILWYDRPARRWDQALPAGNGRLGCMQFGGVYEECWQLNEDSVWDGFCGKGKWPGQRTWPGVP